jgi:hypothetical protein
MLSRDADRNFDNDSINVPALITVKKIYHVQRCH